MPLDSLRPLIDQIYDTALDPMRWPETLTLVSKHIGASFMSVVPYDDPASLFVSKGGEHVIKSYTEHWFMYDAMVEVGIRNKNSRDILCDWSSIGIATIKKSSYYQEWRRDVGIGYCLGLTVEVYPGEFQALAINLPLGRRILEQRELATIDSILVHLARAITISSRTQASLITSPAFSNVLDRMRCGAAVVDGTGGVIITNRILRDLANDGFRITSGKIQCARATCQAGLDRLIHNAMSGPPNKEQPDYALVHRPSGRKPFMARAMRLTPSSMEGVLKQLPSHRQALLLVVDLAAEAAVSCQMALQQLGLTSAEAKVAALVGSGHSPRQTAARLGTTEGTVRNQLKHVFSKMELTRQSHLVQIINQITHV